MEGGGNDELCVLKNPLLHGDAGQRTRRNGLKIELGQDCFIYSLKLASRCISAAGKHACTELRLQCP